MKKEITKRDVLFFILGPFTIEVIMNWDFFV